VSRADLQRNRATLEAFRAAPNYRDLPTYLSAFWAYRDVKNWLKAVFVAAATGACCGGQGLASGCPVCGREWAPEEWPS
jgi:hypothetical protein